MDEQNQKLGWLALWLSISGLVLPIILAVICEIVFDKDVTLLCVLLFGTLELAALVCGIIARNTPSGKAAITIGAISLVLLAIVVPSSVGFQSSSSGSEASNTIDQK